MRLELTAFALLARRSTDWANGPTEYKLWDVRPPLLVYEVQKKSKNLVHVRLELTAFALLARRSTDWANGPTD